MKDIILEAREIEGVVFDLGELTRRLNQLTDQRDNRGKVYTLGSLLSMIVLARLSGADKPWAIYEWIRYRRSAFVKLYKLERGNTPCVNTIRTILGDVVLQGELETTLRQYLHEQYGGQSSVLVAIDGKTMRGTIPKGMSQGVHLLTAYLAEEGIVLKQVEVVRQENEISAAPTLLTGLYLKGKVVIADAIQTQRSFCLEVLRQGGHYVLWAKENQSALLDDIRQFFEPPPYVPGWHQPEWPRTVATTCSKGHGRLEKRTLSLIAEPESFIDWPGVQQIFKLDRFSRELNTGRASHQTVYGLTSCPPSFADANQLLQWTQSYWAIENGLHYRRDVTLQEDATRSSRAGLAKAMAILNNFLIGLVYKLGFNNLASARRFFDARIAQQLLYDFY
jgi:predicted transposase YbfD/YdcC